MDYTDAMQRCVTEQMPSILDSAEQLPSKAEEARNSAEGEFDQLDLFPKGKAIMASGFNVKQLSKLTAFIRKSVEDWKADLQELKDAIMELKTNFPTFKEYGVACNATPTADPVACFKQIYGPLRYTQEQRTEWEAKMAEIIPILFPGRVFNPLDYPTTDMIQEPVAAGAKQ